MALLFYFKPEMYIESYKTISKRQSVTGHASGKIFKAFLGGINLLFVNTIDVVAILYIPLRKSFRDHTRDTLAYH